MNKKILLGAATAAVLAAAGAAYWHFSGKSDQPAYRLATLERGSLVAAVSATGTLNPVTSVQVGSQVSGQIKEIYVDFNSRVKQGQIIARIDPESFALRVNQAMADLESGRATALTQRANLAALQAEVSRSQVSLGEAERELKRNQQLVEKGFISQVVLEKSQALVATSHENVKTAQAQRAVGEAQVRNGEALVKQREAQLAQAKVDLERTAIRAPVDGIVISRNVDAGQTVAASLQAPILFLIARNLADMQVDASIDEAEIGRVAIGQEATFTVDSFPGRTFNGKINQVRKAAQVVQNVVTYIAVISAPNADLTLLPGMTANVRIITAKRDDVVRIPNVALRYRPAGVRETENVGKGSSKSAEKSAEKGAEKGSDKGADKGTEKGADKAAKSDSRGEKGEKGGARAQETRERLTRELNLSAEQQAKLEAIQNDTRQKIAGIAADDPAARKKEIGRLRGQSRAQIRDMLDEEQRKKYDAMIVEQQGRAATRGRVWVLDAKSQPKSVNVRLGVSDGTHTELLGDELKSADQVIIGGGGAAARGKPETKSAPPRFGF